MASKKPKDELAAICKLEFYRKQKHWRYGPQDRKAKDSKGSIKTTNAKLNQTYNIQRAPEKQEPAVPEIQETEERHILDEAFVDTETGESDELVQHEDQYSHALENVADKPSSQVDPPGSHYSPKWSIQRWAEQHRLWNPEPIPTPDPICPAHNPACPTSAATYPTHDPTLPQQTNPSEDANCPIFDNNYNIIQDVYYLNLPHKGADYDANYPTQSCYDTKYVQEPFDPKFGFSTVYYNSNMYHHEFDVPQCGASLDTGKVGDWQVDYWERCAGEGAVWSDPDWVEVAAAMGAGGEDAVDGNGQLPDLSDVSCGDSVPSVASSEFVRGAALAPHSTQIDLSVDAEPAAEVRHSLLAEAQRRQMTPQPSALCSFDEAPVRDPDSGLPAPAFRDHIVAGSFQPDRRGSTGTVGHTGSAGQSGTAGQTESGRGRGRLKVGIRMGRPYRV